APTIAGPAALNVGHDSADVRWTTDEPADGLVEYGETAALGRSSALDAAPVAAHDVQLRGLRASTKYRYQVRSRDAAGNLSIGPVGEFTTRAAPNLPPVVTLAVLENARLVAPGSVPLAATASDPDGRVDRVAFYADDAKIGETSATRGGRFELLWDGAPAGSHAVVAKAFDGQGASGVSAPVLVAIGPDQPPTARWAAPRDGETVTGRRVELVAEASDDVAVASVRFQIDGKDLGRPADGSPAKAALDTTALADGTHSLAVIAKDEAGAETSARITVIVDNAPPAILDLAVEARAPTSVVIRWRTSEPALSSLEHGPTRELGRKELPSARGREHRRSLEGLEPDKEYYFRIEAADALGHRSESPVGSFATLPDVAPPASPGAPRAVAIGPHAVELEWDEPADDVGVVRYELDAALDAAFERVLPWFRGRAVEARRLRVGGLEAGKTHFFRIRALDGASNASGFGPSAQAATLQEPDPAPGGSIHVIADPRRPPVVRNEATRAELALSDRSLAEPETITLRPIATPNAALPEGGRLVGQAHEFGPDGLRFEEAARLTLRYDATEEGTAVLHHLDAATGRWEPVPGSVAGAETVSAPIRHFSVYAAIAVPQDALLGSAKILEVYAFPNPARRAIPTIRAELASPADTVEARVYSLHGELVTALPLPGHIRGFGPARYEAKLTAALPSGVYWVAVIATRRNEAVSSRKTKLAIVR
ncbi:MAG: hypothetical protein HY554_13495, partial [Elusimicrobia bacterium]|nr:hypothetical protein [Elusimicrobiota bacterium]